MQPIFGQNPKIFEWILNKSLSFQENEIMPSVYTGLSEDDMFISKLLAAQNVMVNIQTELTSLIKDYIVIKKKDQIDRRITRLIGTPIAIVRLESYLATLLLAMHNSDILKLDDEEKESFSALIFKESDIVPILKGLSPRKLEVLNKVWKDVP